MASIIRLVFFLVACASLAQVAEKRATANEAAHGTQNAGGGNDRLAESAFQYSHALAVQLFPLDRAELLARMASVAGKKHPEDVKRWALEALRLSSEMRSSVRRAQYETEAISDLASVNSEEALAMLPGLEFPASWNDCDARARAATAVFQEFLKQHPDGWEKLPAVAQRIGDTGDYPFRAIQMVISRIGSRDHEAATALVQQALHYYELSDHGPCANNQLATLLAEHSKFVPIAVLKATLETMLSSLSNADSVFSAKAGATDNEAAKLRDLNRETLATLMPLIGSVDPNAERKLRQEHPQLDSYVKLIPDLEGGRNAVEASASPIENHVAVLFQTTQASQPESSRAESPGGSPTLQALETPSPEDLASFLGDSEAAFKREHDPDQRLQILMERGLSLASAHRTAELADVLTDAFALGEDLFRKSIDDNPQASWKDRPGADALSTLVEAAAKSAPRVVLERIRNVSTSVLQAQLYVSFVEGMQSKPDLPSVMVIRAEK